MALLVNLTPITDHVNFTMSLQCGWSILLKARSNSVISRVIQLSNSFPERTIHEDKRIRKSWELQFRQNKSLERIEINGKLRIGHKSMSRSRNKSRGWCQVVIRKRGKIPIFTINVWNLEEKSIDTPKSRMSFNHQKNEYCVTFLAARTQHSLLGWSHQVCAEIYVLDCLNSIWIHQLSATQIHS